MKVICCRSIELLLLFLAATTPAAPATAAVAREEPTMGTNKIAEEAGTGAYVDRDGLLELEREEPTTGTNKITEEAGTGADDDKDGLLEQERELSDKVRLCAHLLN